MNLSLRYAKKNIIALKVCVVLATMLACVCQVGCNKTPFPVAKVSGTIKTEDGTLLANGQLRFTPMAINSKGHSGKQAFGIIENGKFVMSTYSDGDGAIEGKHRITLTEAWREDEEYLDENSPDIPSHGCEISPEFEQIEVVAGENVFEFVAVPRKERSNIENDDD